MLPRPLALSHIPYGFLASANDDLWGVGDQAAVIPSFTGDGISIALHTARLAVVSFLEGQNPSRYLAQVRTDLGPTMRRSERLSSLLLRPGLRSLAVLAATWAPRLVSVAAGATRISSRARNELTQRERAIANTATAYNERG